MVPDRDTKAGLTRLDLPLTIFFSAPPLLVPVLAIPAALYFVSVLVDLVFHRLARRLALLAVLLLPPAAVRLCIE